MRPTRPDGFGLYAFCSCVCAGCMALLLTDVMLYPGPSLPGRLAIGATGAFGLVTAEALWFVRRWAFPASLAFAGAFVAMLFVAGVVMADLTIGFMLAIVVLIFLFPALVKVRAGIASRYTGAPVPAPRP